jgi:hypothetical protein
VGWHRGAALLHPHHVTDLHFKRSKVCNARHRPASVQGLQSMSDSLADLHLSTVCKARHTPAFVQGLHSMSQTCNCPRFAKHATDLHLSKVCKARHTTCICPRFAKHATHLHLSKVCKGGCPSGHMDDCTGPGPHVGCGGEGGGDACGCIHCVPLLWGPAARRWHVGDTRTWCLWEHNTSGCDSIIVFNLGRPSKVSVMLTCAVMCRLLELFAKHGMASTRALTTYGP